jgi:hypothetical protein
VLLPLKQRGRAAQEVVSEIEKDHGAALAIEAEVSRSDQVEHMISQTLIRASRYTR